MQVALMTYEGRLHRIVEWDGQKSKDGCYMRFPKDEGIDHFTMVLSILPEDVEEYTAKCKEIKDKEQALADELYKFKVEMHGKLMKGKA